MALIASKNSQKYQHLKAELEMAVLMTLNAIS